MILGSIEAHLIGADPILNFVGVGSGNKYYSPYCASWQISAISGTFPGQTGTWTTSAIYNNLFVTIDAGSGSSSNIFRSTDGHTWTSTALPIAGNYYQVATDGINYFAPKYSSNTLITSSNSTSWTSSSLPSSKTWAGAAYNGSKYVITNIVNDPVPYSGHGTLDILYSTDLSTWSSTSVTGLAYAPSPNFIAAGNGMFAAPGVYSNDGVTWVSTGDYNLSYTYGITVFGNNTFVSQWTNYVTSQVGLAYSLDGVHWHNVIYNSNLDPIDTNGWLVFGNHRFYAQTSTGIVTSTDGAVWYPITTSSPTRVIGYGAT